MSVQEYPQRGPRRLRRGGLAPDRDADPALLEDFGEFIVPGLVGLFGAFIKPEWKTLDLIENTEETIHTAVRIRNPGARPPQLSVRRASDDEVVVTYTSARKLCPVAKGISKGVANHYGERIMISEPSCMHRGAPSCQIHVKQMH